MRCKCAPSLKNGIMPDSGKRLTRAERQSVCWSDEHTRPDGTILAIAQSVPIDAVRQWGILSHRVKRSASLARCVIGIRFAFARPVPSPFLKVGTEIA
jgi:hypothetical protein